MSLGASVSTLFEQSIEAFAYSCLWRQRSPCFDTALLTHPYILSHRVLVGILEEFKKIGKPNISLDLFDEERKPLFHVGFAKRPK